jgi:arabinogalactan endo-1,4-beta-galactosidase
MIPRIRFAAAALVALLVAQHLRAAPSAKPFHRTGPFLLGADISWVQEDEANGSTYYDHGKKEDPFQILKDHGFNAIRLRVFVDPASEKGYAHTAKEPFCDLAHTLVMAKRAHDAGMALLIDLHYSDNWADPGKQAKPVAWETLDVAGLKKAVYDHTHKVLTALVKQGTKPLMVQIGNEVSNGMLWPDGNTKEHFDQFAEFLKSGIQAARDVDPTIKVVIHTDKGSNDQLARRWLEGLVSRGVQPDIIGLSCNGTNPPAKWKETFDDLATRFPQFGLIASEYGYHKRELNDIVFNAPDHRGIGTFIWEPTRHHEALFDQDGHNAGQGTQKHPTSGEAPFVAVPGHRPRTARFDTNALIDLYPQMAKDYGDAK